MWEKIKEFFKNIKQILMGTQNTKLLEAPDEKSEKIEHIKTEETSSKEEIFDIYNKIKKGEYNPDELDEEKREKINILLKNELDIKKKQIRRKKIELKMLKQENIANEKIRIMNLYYLVKQDKINLDYIKNEDLYKIRQLLIEEAKIHNKEIETSFVKVING